MSEQEDEDRPWTEAQWEAYLKQADLRAAMYEERLETEFNARQRGEAVDENAISEDMGWQEEYEPTDDDGVDRPWIDDAFAGIDPESMREAEEEIQASKRALNDIVPYQRALDLTVNLRTWLRPQLVQPFDEDSDFCRLLGTLCMGPATCGAKIANGHGMGYNDQMIGGNVVKNRIGRQALVDANDALEELVTMNAITAEIAERVKRQLDNLIMLMDHRIAELRSRITW